MPYMVTINLLCAPCGQNYIAIFVMPVSVSDIVKVIFVTFDTIMPFVISNNA